MEKAMNNQSEQTTRLLASIEDKTAVIGVVGLGYVGLPLAVELATAGFRVIGFDVSEKVCAGVTSGQSHIKDISDERLAPFVADGHVSATTDMRRLAECSAISVCVPTPLGKTRDPD